MKRMQAEKRSVPMIITPEKKHVKLGLLVSNSLRSFILTNT